MLKRSFDLSLSILCLGSLIPVFLLIAILIKLDSRGPVLFRQQRVGKNGALFWIIKFRTMYQDAEKEFGQLTIGKDRRITGIGSFLRAYKIDELPQLINVLVGDMSIVGPRPEVPQFVRFYPDATRKLILSIRPGITDYASIRFRSESDLLSHSDDPYRTYVEEILPVKLSYNEAYARRHSLMEDFRILFHTFHAVVFIPSQRVHLSEETV